VVCATCFIVAKLSASFAWALLLLFFLMLLLHSWLKSIDCANVAFCLCRSIGIKDYNLWNIFNNMSFFLNTTSSYFFGFSYVVVNVVSSSCNRSLDLNDIKFVIELAFRAQEFSKLTYSSLLTLLLSAIILPTPMLQWPSVYSPMMLHIRTWKTLKLIYQHDG